MTARDLDIAKLLAASAGFALLASQAWLARRGARPDLRRLADGGLILVAVCALVLWPSHALFRARAFVNQWDVYHYFMGAKYFPELGYTRLYEAVALADAENGHARAVRARKIRDLQSNRLVATTSVLANPEHVRRGFTPQRWSQFRRDVAYFHGVSARMRQKTGQFSWPSMNADHGFNASPVWVLAGTPLAGLGPASDARLRNLATLDFGLLAGMWLVVWWAFGWRATAVAVIFWGTNLPARYGWTTASLLRHDWLAFTVISLCLLKRGRPGWAGAVAACASWNRLFPVLLVLGLGVRELAWWIRQRRLSIGSESRPFAFGFAAASLILVALATVGAGRGPSVWVEFARNSVTHMATPLSNHMGLAALLSYGPATRLAAIDQEVRATAGPLGLTPWDVAEKVELTWLQARRERLTSLRPLRVALVVLFVAAAAWATRRADTVTAAIIGIGLVPIAGDLTCYYYGVLLVFGSTPSIGAGLCAVAAGTQLAGLVRPAAEDYCALSSGLVLLFVAFAFWRLATRSPHLEPIGASREDVRGSTP